jgi:hypothetical protein
LTPTTTLGEPGDLIGFPSAAPPASLARVCQTGHPTWWFSCDGSGRFDLSQPEGTCYFATDEYAALREASRLGPVTPGWIAARQLREVAPPNPDARLAATTRKGAGNHGVTTEIATLVPYDLTRRWAAAFRKNGFDGIRHQLRHDQRARPSGVSWFGPAGVGAHPGGASTPLTPERMQRAGVHVLPPPPTASLSVVP